MPLRSSDMIFICTILPSVLTKGGNGGPINSSSGLSLPPLLTAAFAFYVIFAVFTTFQALRATQNVYMRVFKRPPSAALPEYSVGHVFSILLLLSTSLLTTYYILNAIVLALRYNQNVLPLDRTDLSQSYINAMLAMNYLVDFLLVACVLALLAHREKVLVITQPVVRRIKIIFDTALVTALLSLGMAQVGLEASTATTRADAGKVDNIYLAYHSLLLVAAADIAVSSNILHIRSKHSPADAHKVCDTLSSNLIQYSTYQPPLSRRSLSSSQLLSLLSSFSILCTQLFSGILRSVTHPLQLSKYACPAPSLVVLSVSSLCGRT